jgi:hypothetical protein
VQQIDVANLEVDIGGAQQKNSPSEESTIHEQNFGISSHMSNSNSKS